jgi:hypothetical protein
MRITKFEFNDDYENRIGFINVVYAPSYDGENMDAVWNKIEKDKFFRQQKFTDVMCKALPIVQPVDDLVEACRDTFESADKSGFRYDFYSMGDDEIGMSITFPI